MRPGDAASSAMREPAGRPTQPRRASEEVESLHRSAGDVLRWRRTSAGAVDVASGGPDDPAGMEADDGPALVVQTVDAGSAALHISQRTATASAAVPSPDRVAAAPFGRRRQAPPLHSPARHSASGRTLRASPTGSGSNAGSSGRTSLLSQQLRGGASEGGSSAGTSPQPRPSLPGGRRSSIERQAGRLQRQRQPHGDELQLPPRRFTMRSALSEELASLQSLEIEQLATAAQLSEPSSNSMPPQQQRTSTQVS